MCETTKKEEEEEEKEESARKNEGARESLLLLGGIYLDLLLVAGSSLIQTIELRRQGKWKWK